MADLKVHVDCLSPLARAVALFVKKTEIRHNIVEVSLLAGEQKTEEYQKNVNALGKVPAINDDGFKLTESVAILKYLALKYDVGDHWYPKNIEDRARVDEFLEWQHLGLIYPISLFIRPKFVIPLLTGAKPDEEAVNSGKQKMDVALEHFESIWLKDSNFVVGDKITIADVLALCVLDQPRAGGYEPSVGRPNITAWLARVRKELHPHYDDVSASLKKHIKAAVLARVNSLSS